MSSLLRRALGPAASALLACALALPAWAADVALFKIVTVKDEIVVGLTPDELAALGGAGDAGAVAAALADRGDLTVWQYATGRGKDGTLVFAPLRRIGLLAANSLRVEPYRSELPVVAPEAK